MAEHKWAKETILKARQNDIGGIWHAVSMRWFKQWLNCTREGSGQIPPVDNNDILELEPFVPETGTENEHTNFQLRPGAHEREDFLMVPQAVWDCWTKHYGGGEVDIKRFVRGKDGMELFFIRAKLVFRPRRWWMPKCSVTLHLSREQSGKDLRLRCERINADWMAARKANLSPAVLRCRMWILPSDKPVDLSAVDQRLKESRSASGAARIELPGKLLDDQTRIGDTIGPDSEPTLLAELVGASADFLFVELVAISPVLSSGTAEGSSRLYADKQWSMILRQNANAGKTGLANLGNTCYFNSGVQCLSHCEELTKYFLLGLYKDEINSDNLLGYKGELARTYAETLESLWNGSYRAVSVHDLKKCIAKKVDQFRGMDQHDSQELILHLLDGIHEDLNRVKKKQYVENSEAAGRPDEVVSREQWGKYLLRNQSIVVDLFAGQFKSRIVCPLCKNVSITFDPFTILSVPIPQMIDMETTFVHRDITRPPMKMKFRVSETSTLSDLSGRIRAQLSLDPLADVYFALVHKSKIYMRARKEMTCADVKYNTGELYAYECLRGEDTADGGLMLEVQVADEKGHCRYPVLVPIAETSTGEEIRRRIFDRVAAPLVRSADGAKDLYHEFMVQTKDPIYVLEIANNRPFASSLFSKKYADCEFCEGRGHSGNCPFVPTYDRLTFKELTSRLRSKRDLVLAAHFGPSSAAFSPEALKTRMEDFRTEEVAAGYQGRSAITLVDCFESFVREDQLDHDNMWYCKHCAKDVQAKKQMDIFRLPRILVVHLKRFKSKIISNYLSQGKIQNFVDYPVREFDVTRFVKANDGAQKYVYDLFAVSNHYGGLQGGHYTATCYNPVAKEWVECDDESVTGTSRIVDPAGYVLFYRLR